jgi:hypothetical protein
MLLSLVQNLISTAWSDMSNFLNQPIIIGLILTALGVFASTKASIQGGGFTLSFKTSTGKFMFLFMLITASGLAMIIHEYVKYNVLK